MKISKFLLAAICGFMALSLLTISCNKDDEDSDSIKEVAVYSAEAALKWNKLLLQIERYAAGYRPGPAPRALGYLGFACYEACISGMPSYNSIEHTYPGLDLPVAQAGKAYHWPTVVHAVYSSMMPKFFPNPPATEASNMALLISQLNAEYQSEAGQEIFDRSLAFGTSVAEVVWNWSTTDAFGHEAYQDPFAGYDWAQNFDSDGDWKPTVPGPPQPMFPHWGKVRTFVIDQDEKLALPPLPYNESPTSEMYSQAIEVYSQNTPTLSYENEWIGEFWSDDLLNLTFSPGPRWIAITNQVIEDKNADLEIAIEAYAKVGMALNDAAVGCWHSKYFYNVERPATYLQRVVDPNWKPALENPINGDEGFTPPFPAYPSGHSTMGAAAAEVLGDVFGYAYEMTDRCHEDRTEFEGRPRTFGSFYEMALENAWSRVPLGVHWRMDCTEGMRMGTAIGRKVHQRLSWKK